MTNGMILPLNNWELHDPFLMCAEDWFSYPGGFEFHPHRGFETVTVVFDGILRHQDSKGNSGLIGPSFEVQWTTTGRGLLHKEVPADKETDVHLMQLWLNLPREQKLIEASYQDLTSDVIPTREIKISNVQAEEEEITAAKIRVISGRSGDIKGPAKNVIPVKALDISILEQYFTLEESIPANYNMFVFILEGNGSFGDDDIKLQSGNVLISPPSRINDCDEKESVLKITNEGDGELRVILFAGKPIKEPVVQHGPFVGNEWDDIIRGQKDLYLGKFSGL
ncbi:8980_t:CDS:2 [Funneliformis geosporum]|uniref:14461_t:CDS:1 n=1 Tax=Funneliformis geosporum TaxID=1117311 RepID=A0A9W4SNS9_9GLOM|nr:8980_t:CDS:2 [Funneliformis geosporum]CAI2177039.1 14461_t:CDS:2 [Funneliformis geosporum]